MPEWLAHGASTIERDLHLTTADSAEPALVRDVGGRSRSLPPPPSGPPPPPNASSRDWRHLHGRSGDESELTD
eukprot:6709312-Alexandrium_andersonii.AAC.1